jgi:shikimate kinase
MNVVLLGMKHCGKSTLGRRLAERLGAAFRDTDEMVRLDYAERFGQARTVREIYQEHGPELVGFLEGQAVGQLWRMRVESPGEPLVAALGGGTATQRRLAGLIRNVGVCLWLQVDCDELWRRVERGGIPAFVDPADPAGSFRRICRRRESDYRTLADATVDLDGKGVDESLRAVQTVLTRQTRGTRGTDPSDRAEFRENASS